MRSALLPLVLLAATAQPACRTHADIKDQYRQMRSNMLAGDWKTAAAQLEASKDKAYKEEDRVMFWLNLGTLHHYAGNYPASQDLLVKAEGAMQELWTKSISSEATKVIVNETIQDYEGEDFEKVLVYLYTALNNVRLHKMQDAIVEARRADELLKKMQVFYEKEGEVGTLYKQDAFMLWLVGLFYEMEGKTGLNDAYLAYKAAHKSYLEDYAGHYGLGAPRFLGEDLVRTATLLGFKDDAKRWMRDTGATGDTVEKLAAGAAEVVLIHGAGEAPQKEEMFIDGTMPDGYVMRIAMPQFRAVPYSITTARVRAGGAEAVTELAEPISQMVLKNFEHRLPAIKLRAIARATIKYAATKAAEAAAGGGDDASGERKLLGALVGLAGNVAAAASEAADLRSWTVLPGSVGVTRLWLPAGAHVLEVSYEGSGGVLGQERINVDLQPGQRQIVSLRSVK